MARDRRYDPLVAADWGSISADRWVAGPMLVDSTSEVGGVLTVILDQSDETAHLGLPLIPVGENLLDAFYLDPTTGQRDDAGPLRYHLEWDYALSSPPLEFTWEKGTSHGWVRDAQSPGYQCGYAGAFKLGPSPNTVGGSYAREITVPLTWWSVDVGTLLYVLTRFYTGAGAGSEDYLDRNAVLRYAESVYSYLRRRRLFTYRQVGESYMDHLKRLAGETSALMRFGGFQEGSTVTQQWGLGVLDWDLLRDVTTVLDADEVGDAGRSMFITTPLVVRATDEYILNSLRSRWGGGWAEYYSGGQIFVEEFPFRTRDRAISSYTETERGPANELEFSDPDSQAIRGERGLNDNDEGVRELPSVLDQESADNLTAGRWCSVGKVVEFGMGPGHFDFDPGDLIHVRRPKSGLDGTEDLLVLQKTVNWADLTAVIQALQIQRDPIPMSPTDDPIGNRLELWVHLSSGITLSGSNVTAWNDASGNARHLGVLSGMISPTITSVADGLAGLPAIRFGSGAARGLGLDGTFRNDDLTYNNGATIIAVGIIDEGSASLGYAATLDQGASGSTGTWGVGIQNSGGSTPEWIYRRAGTFIEAGVDRTPTLDRWIIVTLVVNRWVTDGGGGQVEIMEGSANRGGAICGVNNTCNIHDLAVGFNRYNKAGIWPGRLAEVQVYSSALRPDYIRRLHADIRSRYPGEGL